LLTAATAPATAPRTVVAALASRDGFFAVVRRLDREAAARAAVFRLALFVRVTLRVLDAGRFREAVPELQRARQNPHARLKAMNVLGCCYGELGMLDLAMKQLEEASREIVSMDEMKKEIVYNLGLVYERVGDLEKALACMKQIYEVDYGYRDVAQRVESSYQRNIS